MKLTQQTRRMLKEAHKVALERASRLENCGGISRDKPHFHKAVVCAALRDVALDYRPLNDDGAADLENLSHF